MRYQYGEVYVWVWNKQDEKAEKVFVEFGECGNQKCEVMSGLEEGEMVVKM